MFISSNIKNLREANDWTQEQLAEKVGVSRSTVTQWETGWSQPRMGKVEKLASVFGVSVSDIVRDGFIVPEQMRDIAATAFAYIPLRGRVHAGEWTEPEALEETVISVPEWILERDKDAYAVEVEGDCMSRVYPEGCIVVVSPNSEPQNGSVAVVSIDYGDAMTRRLYRTPQTLVLSPDSYSDEYSDIVITAEDERIVEFGGKVVWFQSNGEME